MTYATYLTDMGRSVAPPTLSDAKARERVLRHHLRTVLPDIRRGPAAELGCGRGEAILALRALGFAPVVGCEISAQQIRAAREAHLDVADEDATTFVRNLPPQSLVTAFDVIEHLEDSKGDELLKAVYANLQPGGWLILQCPNAASAFFGSVQYGDPTHRTVFGPGILRAKLRKVGFESVTLLESEPVPHGPVSAARAVLWKGIRAFLRLYDAVETGNVNGGPYTRVLLAAASKGVTH